MKTAIIYASKHGTTEKVANRLAEKLRNEGCMVDLFNLRSTISPDLNRYERIIIGGSIYGGKIQKGLSNFCENNKDKLTEGSLGLFICCMLKDKAQEEFDNAFCEDLRCHSSANGIMGGEFIFEDMNFVERFFVKRIAKIKSSISDIDYKAINEFLKNL